MSTGETPAASLEVNYIPVLIEEPGDGLGGHIVLELPVGLWAWILMMRPEGGFCAVDKLETLAAKQ